MGEVASISFHAVLVLGVVLAEGRLVEVVKLLTALLRLALHDRNWYELGERVRRGIAPLNQSSSDHGYLLIVYRCQLLS